MGQMAVALEYSEHSYSSRIRQPRLNPQQAFGMSARLFRQNRRLSLEEVAQATGINEALLGAFEDGEETETLTVEDVRKIAATYSCALKINNLKPHKYTETTPWNDIFAMRGRPRLNSAHPQTRRSKIG